MTFTIYAIPAMLGFLTKLGILLYERRAKIRCPQTRLFLLFLLTFALLNVVEMIFFMRIGEGAVRPPGSLGRLWFSLAILAIALLLHFALVTAAPGRSGGRFVAILYFPAVVLQAALWSGPLLIVDFEPMAYTFTKVAGPLYVLWELYVLAGFAAVVGLLLYGAVSQVTAHRRLQNKVLLAGLVPLVALALMIIGLQRFGFRGFNATATLPFASTFLLFVAAYAIYRYRLIDIDFYIPWSSARRRKTALYARIDTLCADIRKLDSPWQMLERLADALRCRVTLLGGPQPWSAVPQDRAPDDDMPLPAAFPSDALKNIDETVTVEEVRHRDRGLYELMIRYDVGAIVPLRKHRAIPGYCLLLGSRFNEEIYSSLDFKIVARLFSAMARRFFEDFLLVRSQLNDVQTQLRGANRNLLRAEQSLAGVRHELAAARKQNRSLREELARLRRASFRLIRSHADPRDRASRKTLEEYLAGREKEAIRSALERAGGRKGAAARMLGIPLQTLNRLIERYRIEPGE